MHPGVWSAKGARQYDTSVGERVSATLEDGSTLKHIVDRETIGWTPTCQCPEEKRGTVPCVVLDPFGGSGTVGRVARGLNRRAILVDIAYTTEEGYLALAQDRCGLAIQAPTSKVKVEETAQRGFGF